MLNLTTFEIALLILCAVLIAVLLAIMWWRIAGERVKALWRGWLALPLLWKIVLPMVFGAFVLHGSVKRGEVSGEGGEVVGDSCSGRTVPSGLFRTTGFEVDSANKILHFSVAWDNDLFNHTLSRNIFLYASTNLLERRWTWLNTYSMPEGTNAYTFAVPLSNYDWAASAFFQFGLDVDSDNDGLIDSYERLCTLTDSANPDSDSDGISDGQEIALGLDLLAPVDPFLDFDGDGLTHKQELEFGSNPLMVDSDGDGLDDATELRNGWNPNWPGETNEANAPGGAFTTFDRYFIVSVKFENPYQEATVYGVSEGSHTVVLSDMVTRDAHKDIASTVTNNIITVTTLDPKPIFTTNVTGVLIVKLRCDDYGVIKIGDFAVTNSWPNTEYIKAWKVIEANSTNEVDIVWDSKGGSKWNFEYECYFYPEKPHLAITNNLWIGLDRTGNPEDPYVSSNIFAQAFITPSEITPEKVSWQYSSICDGRLENGNSLTLWTTNRELASASYRDQAIEATADGMRASSDFTVVKVDVTIGGVADEYEEASQGAFVSFALDGADSVICNHWTNMLQEVRFSCNPINLPSNELVRITNNGCGELYEQLPDDSLILITEAEYQANEISERRFKLHGHSASSVFMEEKISIEHISSGAVDEAPYTVLEINLVPDYDRNGIIDAIDYLKWRQGRVFRFWINDDEDAEATDQYEDSRKIDIPGPSLAEFDLHTPDSDDDEVNGCRDLVDFSPIFMDVSSIDILPKWICECLTFKLSHGEAALKVLWTGLAKYEAQQFQRDKVDCCGRLLNEKSYEASVEEVPAGGIEVPNLLVYEMCENPFSEKGLVFIEGQYSTELPLELEVWFCDKKIAVGSLSVKLSSVEDMYRWINSRGRSSAVEAVASKINAPENLPDEETSDRHLVFVHGATFTEDQSRGWASEMFKRMWQSGMTAKFTGVSWRGDIGTDANYQENVSNAFVTASIIAQEVKDLPGTKILMAHSLGNMVCSAMIQDYEVEPDCFLMCNSAVPVEAYDTDESLRVPQLVHPEWENYPTNSWASNWHALFCNEPDNDRKYLGWPGRFSKVVQYAVNFYSSGDEVLELAPDSDVNTLTGVLGANTLAHFSWHKQELFKGRGGLGGTDWSGWNIEENWLGMDKISVETAQTMTDVDFKTNTVFYCYPQSMNQNVIPRLVIDAHLAQGIPALAPSAGIMAFGEDEEIENNIMVDLNFNSLEGIERLNGWPERINYPERWCHSDIKDVAYFYVYKFFDKVIEKGSLK